MEDENKFKKLPTDEKCVHKLWNVRVAGYEEVMRLFNQIEDEKSPEWKKYLRLIKKFVMDSNAVAQEKGLEATLAFVENCGHAGKTTGKVMSGIVAKCIAAPKTKTKDLALQIILMYIEIEQHKVVEEALLKGMEQKNPKVVAACTAALNTALRQFGNKVIAIKPMVTKIPVLLADRDKAVRDEMKALVIEMHRWIGAAIERHIASLQAVVQQELRELFSGAGGAQPTRYLRSQQNRVRDAPAADQPNGAADDDDAETGGGDSGDVDPYDLLDPVEILSKLPKYFYDKLDAKKWQERKESLDALEALLKTAPRLEPGDYTDLVKALMKTNLEAIMEGMFAAFDNKNPSVKAESSLFLARALCRTQPAAFDRKLIKTYVGGLLKLLESAEPTVRDAAAEALGTATRLVGEKNIAPHMGELDNLKDQKIKEFADKAIIQVKVAAPKKEIKSKINLSLSARGGSEPSAGSSQPEPVTRPASGLGDSNWKNRLSAVQSFHSTVQGISTGETTSHVLFRILNKKPGLKDTNIEVLKASLEACKYITENFPVSTTAANFVLQDVVTKLGEASCSALCAECLTSLAEACGLEHVLNESLTFAMDSQKNPKVQSELFNWMANAIREFGFNMNIKPIVVHCKKALTVTNLNVLTSTVNFLGILSLYVGPSLISHFDSEEPVTRQLISLELYKHANSSPPTPTRQIGSVSKVMVAKSASKASMGEDLDEAFEDATEKGRRPRMTIGRAPTSRRS